MSHIDNFYDKVFYINMAKDVDRNNHMLAQFKEFSINNFERIEGIVIDTLPDKYLYRNFLNEKDLYYRDNIFDKEFYIKGGLGCREAHLNAIIKAKERGYKNILILEDDINILIDPSDVLKMNTIPLSFSNMHYFGGKEENLNNGQLVLAHAYGLNESIFDDIIYMASASGMEIDNFYAKIIQHMSYNYNNSQRYNILKLNPFNTIEQGKSFKSNIK